MCAYLASKVMHYISSGMAVALGSDFNPNAFCMSMVSHSVTNFIHASYAQSRYSYSLLLSNSPLGATLYSTYTQPDCSCPIFVILVDRLHTRQIMNSVPLCFARAHSCSLSQSVVIGLVPWIASDGLAGW